MLSNNSHCPSFMQKIILVIGSETKKDKITKSNEKLLDLWNNLEEDDLNSIASSYFYFSKQWSILIQWNITKKFCERYVGNPIKLKKQDTPIQINVSADA